MFIKDQVFTDEDTLLEMLFDFSLGDATSEMKQMIVEIDKELAGNEKYIAYRNSLPTEDDRTELYTEERDLRLAERLMAQYSTFEVKKAGLYAVKGDNKVLLYTIDLY